MAKRLCVKDRERSERSYKNNKEVVLLIRNLYHNNRREGILLGGIGGVNAKADNRGR